MSWRDDLSDEARAEMAAINANLSHVRVCSSATRRLRVEGGQVVEVERPAVVRGGSMFPYKSTSMCVDPQDVPQVAEQLRKQGLFVEFDPAGRPIIESAKQHADLAKALGMKTGRDGYGHTDEYGRFQNSGRRRADEMAAGKAKIRKARETLEAMPEDSAPDAVSAVLREFDVFPTDDNTG